MPKAKATKKRDPVAGVKVMRPYVLQVTFASGRTAEIDLEPRLWGPVFAPLRDPERFAEVKVDQELGTVVWPTGADLAPEILDEAADALPHAAGEPRERGRDGEER